MSTVTAPYLFTLKAICMYNLSKFINRWHTGCYRTVNWKTFAIGSNGGWMVRRVVMDVLTGRMQIRILPVQILLVLSNKFNWDTFSRRMHLIIFFSYFIILMSTLQDLYKPISNFNFILRYH